MFRGILLLILLFSLLMRAQSLPELVLGPNPEVAVHGSSNVASFSCIAKQVRLDAPIYGSKRGTRVVFDGPPMRIPVRELNCGNPLMNRDLCATLNADRHPEVLFFLESIEFQWLARLRRDGYCNIKVVLAGVARTYRIPFRYALTDRALVLTGTLPLAFSEFNLEPPRKMAGAISVYDRLEVRFNLPFAPATSAVSAAP